MRVAERVDEFPLFKIADLRDHRGEQRVRSDVERHAEKNIAGALIELARQTPIGDKELKQTVTRREGHGAKIGRVPCADHEPSR